MIHHARAGVAALGLLALTLSGCGSGAENSDVRSSSESTTSPGSSSQATSASSTDEFWIHLRPYSASEIDPAIDLEDLSEQATNIVRGRVTKISAGPSYPDTSDDGQVDKGETSFVTVAVERNIKGASLETVTVWLSGPGGNLNIPEESYLWYLKPSERADVMYPASLTGVIGAGDNGLSTVLSPGDASFIIPRSVDSVSEMEAQTERLAQD